MPMVGLPQESAGKLSEELSQAECQACFAARGERKGEMQHANSNGLDGQDERLAFSLMRHYGTQESTRFQRTIEGIPSARDACSHLVT